MNITQRGYAIVLSAHDDGGHRDLLGIYNRQFRAHVDVRTVRDRVVQCGNSLGKGVHDFGIGGIRVIAGEVFDVAVDLRRSSPTFGKWVGATLSANDKRMLWIPPGFAHGFLVTSDFAEFLYKATDYYAPEHERTLAWNDPTLAIAWPINGEPVLSRKDVNGAPFAEAETYS